MMLFSLAMRRDPARAFLASPLSIPVALFALALVACNGTPIQHGLDESSANEVVTALESVGIPVYKIASEGGSEAQTFSINVQSSGDVARALDLMHSRGLPRGRRSGLAEMYGQPSLVPSPTEERARFIEALGNDIERTLETIEGVVSAHVHLVLAENDPLAADPRPRVPAQASVLLKTRAGFTIPVSITDIQKLVAGSVPGLTAPAVAVVYMATPDWTGAGAPMMVAIGPMRMTPGSRTILGSAFAAALGVVAILALILLFTARRLAAVQRERRA
jgi:type III secretion protein J